jgi:hypothetical protein
MTAQQVAELQDQCLRAFQKDLPRLWVERPGQWVAYQAGHVVGFAAHKHELYQECFGRNRSPAALCSHVIFATVEHEFAVRV